jgi:preprotein translocase subunit Sec61beta
LDFCELSNAPQCVFKSREREERRERGRERKRKRRESYVRWGMVEFCEEVDAKCYLGPENTLLSLLSFLYFVTSLRI